jgi:hypothetical protein
MFLEAGIHKTIEFSRWRKEVFFWKRILKFWGLRKFFEFAKFLEKIHMAKVLWAWNFSRSKRSIFFPQIFKAKIFFKNFTP